MTDLAPIPVQSIMAEAREHQALPRDPNWAAGAAYVINRFDPIGRAAVPITDLGFLRADAVYDVVSVSRGQFFRLQDHQARFARSCARMALRNPFSPEAEASLLNVLVAKTGLKDAYVWWAVTRGANPSATADRVHAGRFRNRFYAFVVPYVFIKDDAERRMGIHLHVARKHIRIPVNAVDPRAKNFCSLDLSMALMDAGERGADWVVMTDGNGVLTEAPGSNIFVVANGEILTPDVGCLEGITRMTVRELCAELGLPVRVGTVTVEALMSADEAFLTSSAGGIIPVAVVDGCPLCQRAGPVSTRLHNHYWTRRWAGWHGMPVDYGADELGAVRIPGAESPPDSQ
ncbi:MAG: aminotransferase class IV [Paracoccaceae bacterium]|nr:aminotransferase class IV [Paracoccaceae bacterium]